VGVQAPATSPLKTTAMVDERGMVRIGALHGVCPVAPRRQGT
jgi:hypothetical protein